MISVRPSRRRHSRLAHLESLLASDTSVEQVINLQTEEDCLVQFKQWAAEGLYKLEPDFPWLLNRFEQALLQAQVSIDPSFYPPKDLMPLYDEPDRLNYWRSQYRFPEVFRTLSALLIMTERVLVKEPPITRSEWEQLKEWYLTERHRLPIQSGAITLPSGKSVSSSTIDHQLKVYDGIIIDGAVTALNDMRLLHQYFSRIMN